MMTPLRLTQTRLKKLPGCPADLSLQNYPNFANDPKSDFPACGQILQRSTDSYRDAGAGFKYEVPGQGHANCGAYGCYGPEGYIVTVSAAKDYRTVIDKLVADKWIDAWTESVAAHLQFANAQTGCVISATALFEFGAGGRVQPQLDVRDLCQPASAPKLSEGYELFSLNYVTVYDIILFVMGGVFILRGIFGQVKLFRSALASSDSDDSFWERVFKHASVSWGFDTALGVAFLVFFVLLGFRSLENNGLLDDHNMARFQSMHTSSFGKEMLDKLTSTALKVLEMKASNELSADHALFANNALTNAFSMGAVFNGTGYGLPVLDLRLPLPYIDSHHYTFSEINVRAARSIAFMILLVKTIRYFQAWRPLASRFAGLAANIPYVTRFFILLVHLHFCFSLQANLLFGFELYEFQSLESSFLQLLQLLTGRIVIAQRLIEVDSKKGSFVGRLFLFCYMILLVLSGSSLIISVLAESWSNATETLRRRRDTRREMRKAEKLAAEVLQSAITSDITEEEVFQMADEAEAEAEQLFQKAQEHSHKIAKRRTSSRRSAQSGATPDKPSSSAGAVPDEPEEQEQFTRRSSRRVSRRTSERKAAVKLETSTRGEVRDAIRTGLGLVGLERPAGKAFDFAHDFARDFTSIVGGAAETVVEAALFRGSTEDDLDMYHRSRRTARDYDSHDERESP